MTRLLANHDSIEVTSAGKSWYKYDAEMIQRWRGDEATYVSDN